MSILVFFNLTQMLYLLVGFDISNYMIMFYFLNLSMAPSARLAMTRRVHPLVSLNPYQGNWTIKVSVTSKGNMRTYKNARGEGCVFNVELTDEDVSYKLICVNNFLYGHVINCKL